MFCLAEKNSHDKAAEEGIVSSLPSNLREQAKEILGEDLVSMPTVAEVQFMVLMNEYDKVCKQMMHTTQTKAKDDAQTQSPYTGTQHSSDNQIIAEDNPMKTENSVIDVPNNETLASCASQIEDFRRCSLTASKMNTDSFELIRKLDGEPDCESDNDDCKIEAVATDAIMQSEREHKNDEQKSDEGAATSLWKANAMVKIDKQLTSLNSTVSKAAYVEALRDVDDLRRDNSLLINKLSLSTTTERDNANVEHVQLNGSDRKSSSVESIISLQSSTGDVHREEETTSIALKKVTGIISEYIRDLQSLHSKCSLAKSHNAEENRVSRQIACLNSLVKEKNRVILALRQKLTTQTEQYKIGSMEASKRPDDSFSSFGSIESIGNLAKCSPKRSFYELRLEEASKLIVLKEREVETLQGKIADSIDEQRQLSKQLEDTNKQKCFLESDISTLVNKLSKEESKVAELENGYKDAKTSLEITVEENTRLKAKLAKIVKESRDNETKIEALEADLLRSKRVLSVARQGRTRSDSTLQAEKTKLASSQEEIDRMKVELNDLKAKMVAATEDKLAANKRARAAVSKLKLLQKVDPESQEKVKNELEQRVNVLNQTVSGLATQNSKLRCELTRTKKEKDELRQNMRPTTASEEQLGSRIRCKQCKSLEARIVTLEQSLNSEKKQGSENRHMLEIYQKRNFTLEQNRLPPSSVSTLITFLPFIRLSTDFFSCTLVSRVKSLK